MQPTTGALLQKPHAHAEEDRSDAPVPTSSPRTALADKPIIRFIDRPVSFNLVLGIATPVGEVGGLVECNVIPWMAIGIGVGASPAGPQYGGTIRLRALRSEKGAAHALDLVAGGSGGAYEKLFNSSDDPRGTPRMLAFWVQPSVEYEFLASSGFRFTTGIGAAVRVARSDETCTSTGAAAPCSPVSVPPIVPTFNLSFGFAI